MKKKHLKQNKMENKLSDYGVWVSINSKEYAEPTSVEWLVNELKSTTKKHLGYKNIDIDFKNKIEQAKHLHKKQSLELIELTAQLTGAATVDSEIGKMEYIDVYNQYYKSKTENPNKTTHALLLELGFKKDETADIPSYFKNFGNFIEDDYEYCFCIFQDINDNFYTQIMGRKVILNDSERLISLFYEVTGEKLN